MNNAPLQSPAVSMYVYITALETADLWLDNFPLLIQQRKLLAVNTKPNPVTKVAERLAEVDENECVMGSPVGEAVQSAGELFLESIHDEIDSVNIADLRRHVASNQEDAIAAIHLNRVHRFEAQEEEAREQEKKKVDKTVA